MDGNGDRVVDAGDPAWLDLLLWTDRNHDGTSSLDELQPVAQSIVVSLGTEYRTIGKKDRWGNHFRFMSKFHVRHGQTTQQRPYYDVFFLMAP